MYIELDIESLPVPDVRVLVPVMQNNNLYFAFSQDLLDIPTDFILSCVLSVSDTTRWIPLLSILNVYGWNRL